MNTKPNLTAVFTVEDLRGLLGGLSRNSIYAALRRGDIPSIRIGKRIIIPKAAVERMLENAGRPVTGEAH
jgi:excisionase family DNA binding protein